MATLVGNVNSTSEGPWTVSEDILDSTDYLQIDDEVVRVKANFHSSIYAPTGETIQPKIRAERGVGGTTKASHTSGATLTPVIPPSTGTGGAGETNVYVQPDDPGAVGAGKLWVDTTTDVASIQRRNADDDGWVDLLEDYRAAGFVTVTSAPGEFAGLAGGAGGVGSSGGIAEIRGGSGDDGNNLGASIEAHPGDSTIPGLLKIITDGLDGEAGQVLVRIGGGLVYADLPEIGPFPKPEVPASPTEQDIVDALLALGLVTQAAP